MSFLLAVYLKLILLFLLTLIIQMTSGTQLLMTILLMLLKITPIVLALLNVFLNLKNLMVLDLNPLIPSLLNISFHYSLLCVLLLLGFLLLVLTILEIRGLIISKFVMFINAKAKSPLGIILFSILGLLFSICAITTM